ncbi:MAG: hypothetical protein LCH67_06870 [Bacteroidetes bacterium]|nr:hypothetical protein [Bacteroidota bacterium]
MEKIEYNQKSSGDTNLKLPTGGLHFFARPKKRSKKRAVCAKCHEKFYSVVIN